MLGTGPRLHKPDPGLPSGALGRRVDRMRPRGWRVMAALLSQVAVVENLAAGIELVAARLRSAAVTIDGDLTGAGWVSGGSDRKPSTLEIASEIDRLKPSWRVAEKQAVELPPPRRAPSTNNATGQGSRGARAGGLNESDAAISAVYEQLGRLGQEARLADADRRRQLGQRRTSRTTAR